MRQLKNGRNIYRCRLKNGKLVMKFINLVKAFYVLHQSAEAEQIA